MSPFYLCFHYTPAADHVALLSPEIRSLFSGRLFPLNHSKAGSGSRIPFGQPHCTRSVAYGNQRLVEGQASWCPEGRPRIANRDECYSLSSSRKQNLDNVNGSSLVHTCEPCPSWEANCGLSLI